MTTICLYIYIKKKSLTIKWTAVPICFRRAHDDNSNDESNYIASRLS